MRLALPAEDAAQAGAGVHPATFTIAEPVEGAAAAQERATFVVPR